MAIKTFTTGEVLTASDTNTYLANSAMTYITTLTASNTAVSAFVDGVFTSTYQNYMIIGDWFTGGNATLSFRLRVGGSDDMTASYYDRGNQNTTGAVAAINNLAVTAGFFGASTSSDYAHTQQTLFFPQIASRRTAWNLQSVDSWNVQMYSASGVDITTSQFDGIKFISSSGNITGTFRFYGIRQA